MWPFSSKKTLSRSGFLNGFTDWHSHILPGVDDGVKTLDESLQILSSYESEGIAELWLTPHIMEDTPNTPDALRKAFEDLKRAYRGPVTLHLAAENMLDNLFEQRLAAGNLLPIGENADHLLVETSYFTPPSDFDDKIQRVKSAGFFPVLAHPERYVYMPMKKYEQLIGENVRFQLNIYSLLGLYGDPAREKAEYLLRHGYYTLIGTDTHRHTQLTAALAQKVLSPTMLRALRNIPNTI